jgi:hypothetical protein
MGLTYVCDHVSPYGTCPQRITLTTTDPAAAETRAALAGWDITPTRHLCARYHATITPPSHTTRSTTDDR